MITLRLASDLHLEFLGDYHSHCANNGRDWNSYTVIPKMKGEKDQILILAGDIMMIKFRERFKPFFKDLSERFEQVITIMGNHEHYRHNFLRSYEDYKEFLYEFDNVIVLQNEALIIDDVAFFMATLWTNFDKRNKSAMLYASQAMSDYRVIEYAAHDGTNHMMWTPELSVLEHEKTLVHMKEFFKKYKDMKKVVVSHHLPSTHCTSIQFLGSALNPAFCSYLDDLIIEHAPDVWMYGHTHDSGDFMIGNTRMLCNPRGYDNGAENAHGFNPFLTVQI